MDETTEFSSHESSKLSNRRDKIIAEKARIIRYLQNVIDEKNTGCNTVILPHDSSLKICKIVNDNNDLERPSAFILKHNGYSITSVEILM